jgi:hypothetical protein
MKSIIVAIAMFLSLAAAPARATNFNIFFETFIGGPIIGSGIYTAENGQLTAFHAIITGCFNAPVVCNFNGGGGPDPFDGIPSETVFNTTFPFPPNGSGESVLHLFESGPNFFTGLISHDFTTHTPGSNDPSGVYIAVATPEPSALWLLLAGSLSLLWMKLSRR